MNSRPYRLVCLGETVLFLSHADAICDLLVVLCSPCSEVLNENLARKMHIPPGTQRSQPADKTPNVADPSHLISA